MIAFRDFAHKPASFEAFLGVTSKKEWFERAVAEANEWVDSESIDVLNFETLGAFMDSRVVRVWYRTPSTKPQPHHEV